jgi:hypothetical protein
MKQKIKGKFDRARSNGDWKAIISGVTRNNRVVGRRPSSFQKVI